MKVLAELGKLRTGATVVITDNKIQPFVVARDYDPSASENEQWSSGTYFASLIELALYVTYTEMPIGYQRMSEIASKAIDGLREDDEENAFNYLVEDSDLDMTDEELEYFGFVTSEV